MERFLDRRDQENSKTGGGKGQIGKIQKNKKKRMKERKRRDVFTYVEVPILMCSPYSCATLPQENHSYGNLPYNIFLLDLQTNTKSTPSLSQHSKAKKKTREQNKGPTSCTL
jgi:hypothetical protein